MGWENGGGGLSQSKVSGMSSGFVSPSPLVFWLLLTSLVLSLSLSFLICRQGIKCEQGLKPCVREPRWAALSD